jgi:hypothetical protein
MEKSEETKNKKVSFSQYSMWSKCPYSWKLNYLEGKRIYDASINTCFGTAIHFVLQTYIEKLYKESAQIADALDCIKMFKEKFDDEIVKAKSQNPKFNFNDDEYTEFYYNGEDILKAFLNTSTRIKHFPSNKYEFVGVELPLDAQLRNSVDFIAYVDLILKEKATGKIKIYDFKTSGLGWNKYQQADPAKYEQILLYKAFYSKKFNVPLSSIEVEFFILKRKLYENVNFPQSHIQLFAPTHNAPAVATTLNSFSEFINECFTPTGEYNISGKYPKIPGKAKKNCKYCPHLKVNCDGKADKLEN